MLLLQFICLNIWLRYPSELVRTSPQQLVDHEASEFVFCCARYFAVTTAGEGVEMAVLRLECQPGPVGAVRIFEAYNITIFHWSTIFCIAGIDLEKSFEHGQRVAPSPRHV